MTPGPQAPAPAPAGPGGPVDGAPALRAGDRLEVELLRVLGERDGLVRLGGRTVTARFPQGVPEGARIRARVESPGPPLVLRAEPGPRSPGARLARPPASALPQVVDRVLSRLAASEEPGGPAARLLSLLSLPRDPAELGPALARWVPRSGVFHEAALARGEDPGDLKSLVLQLLARRPDGETARALEALWRHVESFQGRSAVEGSPVVPLALPWGGETVRGELWLDPDAGAPGRRAEGRTVRVRLELPRLGTAEAWLGWGEGGVSVRLVLEPDAVPRVEARLEELARGLASGARVRVSRLTVEPRVPAPADEPANVIEVIA